MAQQLGHHSVLDISKGGDVEERLHLEAGLEAVGQLALALDDAEARGAALGRLLLEEQQAADARILGAGEWAVGHGRSRGQVRFIRLEVFGTKIRRKRGMAKRMLAGMHDCS